MNILRSVLLVIACFVFGSTRADDASTTTIILVRHAEKASNAADPKDPPLSQAGQQRAQRIAEKLRDNRVTAVYATQYARTQQTAAPTAAQHQLPVRVLWMGKRQLLEQAIELKQEILRKHQGSTVLIVGHSNTLPVFAEAFSGTSIKEISEQEYDRWVEVSIQHNGQIRLHTQQY